MHFSLTGDRGRYNDVLDLVGVLQVNLPPGTACRVCGTAGGHVVIDRILCFVIRVNDSYCRRLQCLFKSRHAHFLVRLGAADNVYERTYISETVCVYYVCDGARARVCARKWCVCVCVRARAVARAGGQCMHSISLV